MLLPPPPPLPPLVLARDPLNDRAEWLNGTYCLLFKFNFIMNRLCCVMAVNGMAYESVCMAKWSKCTRSQLIFHAWRRLRHYNRSHVEFRQSNFAFEFPTHTHIWMFRCQIIRMQRHWYTDCETIASTRLWHNHGNKQITSFAEIIFYPRSARQCLVRFIYAIGNVSPFTRCAQWLSEISFNLCVRVQFVSTFPMVFFPLLYPSMWLWLAHPADRPPARPIVRCSFVS